MSVGLRHIGSEWICRMAALNPDGRGLVVGLDVNAVRDMAERIVETSAKLNDVAAVFLRAYFCVDWPNGFRAYLFTATRPAGMAGHRPKCAWVELRKPPPDQDAFERILEFCLLENPCLRTGGA